ncbi:MAG: RAMP superfamily CRISPR-associated protein [Methylococcaceae bacterium]
MMQQREYTVRFNTPAFLGNAQQSGQWRTPPFKALIRQWWRVAYAAQNQFNVNVTEMREQEGALFGSVHTDLICKSRVRLRLSEWNPGTLPQWPGNGPHVNHPEVGNGPNGMNVSADLYLGYGPLRFNAGQTSLQADKFAINEGETANLLIAVPENEAELIWQALWLMDRYGTVGGRSRNGWGSFSLQRIAPEGADAYQVAQFSRPFVAALNLDWPHAIGQRIWQTQIHTNWRDLMQTLARLKIGYRTQFPFQGGHQRQPADRHWLAYPVTNHKVNAWGNQTRLPNSLRFKIRRQNNNQYVGVIFHVPCRPPAELNPNGGQITDVWNRVYEYLSHQNQRLKVINVQAENNHA